MKKILYIAIAGLLTAQLAQANLNDCIQAGQQKNYDNVIKYCKPLANSNGDVIAVLVGAYAQKDMGLEAQKYLQLYVNKFATNEANISKLQDAYTALGNYYYFGEDGATKDIPKGLAYITKGAELGSAIAQNQLGDIYTGDNPEVPQNMPLSYQWYQIATINGNSKARNSYVMTHLDDFKEQLPYCYALGQDNVGQAYHQGIGGLPQSNNQALQWMKDAQATDPSLSVINLDLAKMYYLMGEQSKAFDYAQKAISQPLPMAYQYLASFYAQGTATKPNPTKAAAYLTLAIELYQNPDKAYWSKYEDACMPNYQGTTDGFNLQIAQKQLSEIKLNAEEQMQVKAMVDEIKSTGWE